MPLIYNNSFTYTLSQYSLRGSGASGHSTEQCVVPLYPNDITLKGLQKQQDTATSEALVRQISPRRGKINCDNSVAYHIS